MTRNIWHYLSSHFRIGGAKIRKPHHIEIFVYETNISMKFSEKDYDLFWEIHKVIDEEMKLNYSLSHGDTQ